MSRRSAGKPPSTNGRQRRKKAADAELGQSVIGHIATIAAMLRDSLIANDVLVDSVDGFPLTIGEPRLVRLAPNGTQHDELKLFALVSANAMISRADRQPPNEAVAYLFGWIAAMGLLASGLSDQQEIIQTLTKHRALGGKAKRSLSADQEKVALEYIKREQGPTVSTTTTCNRAAARLYRDRGINVSGKTLSRILKKVPDNAEQCPGQSSALPETILSLARNIGDTRAK